VCISQIFRGFGFPWDALNDKEKLLADANAKQDWQKFASVLLHRRTKVKNRNFSLRLDA